jgi:hypothetical protein
MVQVGMTLGHMSTNSKLGYIGRIPKRGIEDMNEEKDGTHGGKYCQRMKLHLTHPLISDLHLREPLTGNLFLADHSTDR